MKRITIDGKDYTIEFSIEATMYNECIENVMDMIITAGKMQDDVNGASKEDENSVNKIIDAFKNSVSEIPKRALNLFYGGLLEHHGMNGDRTVNSISDAKKLMTTYIKENNISLYEILNDMVEQMGEDHFFDMIGVEKMVSNATPKKVPQDHKRKSKSGEN